MISNEQATDLLLKQLTDFLREHPSYGFGAALHELKIVQPIRIGQTIIGCRPCEGETSLATLNRVLDIEIRD